MLQLKIALPALALVALFFAMSSVGVEQSLDIRFYYSPDAANSFFSALSDIQRELYLKHELIDLLFLISYSTLFFFILERMFPKQRRIKFIGLIPGVFDFFETSGIIAVLLGTPVDAITPWLGSATAIKWATGSILVAAILLIGTRRTLRAQSY